MSKKPIESFLKLIEFLNFAKKICEEQDKVYEFDCPTCGCKATVIASGVNGHITAKCSNSTNCGMWIMG